MNCFSGSTFILYQIVILLERTIQALDKTGSREAIMQIVLSQISEEVYVNLKIATPKIKSYKKTISVTQNLKIVAPKIKQTFYCSLSIPYPTVSHNTIANHYE